VLTQPRIADLALALTAKYPVRAHLSVRMADLVLGVHTNSAALHTELTRYFQPFLVEESQPPAVEIFAVQAPAPELDVPFRIKPPEPGKTKIKEEWFDTDDGRIVRKRLTGMLFLFGAGHHVAVGDCEANPNQVINFVNNRFLEYRLQHGGLLAHAAAVILGHRGVALAGFSGMGKSTLALHLVTEGATFVSNDRLVLVRQEGTLHAFGVAKHPRINPGTILGNPALAPLLPEADRQRFAALPADELWTLEAKYDAPIHELFGADRFRLATPLHALAILNWRRDNTPVRLQAVDVSRRPDLLPAFMKDPGLFFLAPTWQHPSPADYVSALEGCPVFEISGGVNFAQAARLLRQELSA